MRQLVDSQAGTCRASGSDSNCPIQSALTTMQTHSTPEETLIFVNCWAPFQHVSSTCRIVAVMLVRVSCKSFGSAVCMGQMCKNSALLNLKPGSSPITRILPGSCMQNWQQHQPAAQILCLSVSRRRLHGLTTCSQPDSQVCSDVDISCWILTCSLCGRAAFTATRPL